MRLPARHRLLGLSAAAVLSVGLCAVPQSAEAAGQSKWETMSRVVVDLSEQHVYVYSTDDALLARWPVSTGGPRHRTPTGRYRVTTRSASTFAISNPSVTMRWMTRFKGGIGFHAIPRENGRRLWTPLGRYGVSHGCVRLEDRHAKILYTYLPERAIVVVRP